MVFLLSAADPLVHSYPQRYPRHFHRGFDSYIPFKNSHMSHFYMKSASTIITKLLIYSQI